MLKKPLLCTRSLVMKSFLFQRGLIEMTIETSHDKSFSHIQTLIYLLQQVDGSLQTVTKELND